MFESITEAILRHKEVVIAAIAITALAGYVVPLNQFAVAQEETTELEDSDAINQEGTATSNPSQSSTVEAPNTQTNAIVTGDATATQTNVATSESNANSVAYGGADGGHAFSAVQGGSTVIVQNNDNTADTSADNNDQTNTNTQSFDIDQAQSSVAEVENLAQQINDNYFNLDFSEFEAEID
jgi:hypothetical protein